MPKAKNTVTTGSGASAPPLRTTLDGAGMALLGGDTPPEAHPSRRALFGASAAMLLLGTAEAGAAEASDTDCDLLSLCSDYLTVEADYRRLSVLGDVIPSTQESELAHIAAQELTPKYRVMLDDIAETPARTPEGLAAKARTIMAFYRTDDGKRYTFEGNYPIQRAMWSLVEDVAGRAA